MTLDRPTRAVVRGLVLRGPRLHLRDLKPDDASVRYCQWMNDPDVSRYLESRFQHHTVEALRAYISETSRRDDTMFWAIVLDDGDRHIGNVKLGPIDWHHRRGDIGILLGEKDCWGRGYATDALRLVVQYGFDQLGLHKLTAGCYAEHRGSIDAFRKAGFVEDGIRRSHYSCEGRYVDLIQLGLIESDRD